MNTSSGTCRQPSRAASLADITTNVLFVDHTAKLGGGEIALLKLVSHLDPKRYKPTVLLFSHGPLEDELRQLGIKVHILPAGSGLLDARKDALGVGSLLKIRAALSGVRLLFRVMRFITRSDAEIIHTNSLKSDIIGGIAGRLAGRKVLWHVRDRIDSNYLPTRVASLFRRLAHVVPQFVIANSASTLETLTLGTFIRTPTRSAMQSRGVPTRVVHCGTEDTASAQDHQPLASARPIVAMVGRLTRWKGQHVFIEAAAIVRQKFPMARFQIIGSAMFDEDEYEASLRQSVAKLGLTGDLEFTGFMTDVPALIANANVIAHASITGEPFGQVLIEAMVQGKPVVATRGGGVPEIVVDEVTGLLVPMDDAPALSVAICTLLDDPDRAKQMGAAGRSRVLKHFLVEHTAFGVQQVYDELLSTGRVSQPRDREPHAKSATP